MINTTGILRLLVTLAVVAGYSIPAQAGWVEVDNHGRTSYFSSDGKVTNAANEPGGMWNIIDFEAGTMTMVAPKSKSYAKSTMKQYCEEMSAFMEKYLKEAMKDMPPEQRSMMEQMKKRVIDMPKPKVAVVKKGAGGIIAGHKTVLYSVTVNGRPYKDVWIAQEGAFVKDMKKYMKKADEMSKKMDSCISEASGSMASNPENSPQYTELMFKGWLMKEVTKDGQMGGMGSMGDAGNMEIVKLEKKKIPASKFLPPAGYKKRSISAMMSGIMGGE
ncbi:MAG: hypothetical protein IIB56_17740 [Planctomycetes bacterium]|nr:hypothetical protein [Planctomycetota bacterium]